MMKTLMRFAIVCFLLLISPLKLVAATNQPNVVFILVDDLRWNALGCMGHPFLQTPNIDRIASEGMRFDNAFTTISLCSPSRAGFLTGTYPQLNGVKNNEDYTDPDPSVPNMGQLMQTAGYETAFIGKWHMKKGGQPRAGFDYWLGFDGQGVYIDPPLNDNGREIQAKGYMTDLLTQYAVDWLRRPHKKPFLLYLSHKAVHMKFTPAERHKNLYLDVQAPELPNWRDTLAGKPEWQRAAWVWDNRRAPWLQNRHTPVPDEIPVEPWESQLAGVRLQYYQTLSAVDDGVGEVLKTLEQMGELDNTILVFSSDNGFRIPGEKRIKSDKRTAHEESMRIPMLVRFPKLVDPGSVSEEMVLNIDLLPTFLSLAGSDVPSHIQGRSFAPLLAGQDVPWRDSFLYEYFMEEWVPGIPGVYALRTKEWKYMMYPDIKSGKEPYETLQDMDELYNLSKDPHELKNLADNPEYRNQLNLMKAKLDGVLKNVDRQ